MSVLLTCQNLTKSFTSPALFSDISFTLSDGERTGLIGPNGSGKSTLLKIVAGVEKPDDGSMNLRRQLRLGYLPQHDVFPAGATVEEVVAGAIDDPHLDEHERETRVAILLGRIGFPDAGQKVETLSGGWKKRAALARELIKEPELLLLDEPTNHLDLEGILWLEKLLKNAPFAFLLISHDRYFLENVTNRTIELNRAYADGYLGVNGPYTEFLVKKGEYLAAQQSQQQSLAGRVRREIEWLQRGAQARTTKSKGRIQQAGRMMEELSGLKYRNAQGGKVQIDFAATNRQTRKLLTAKGVEKSLGGRMLFGGLDLVLSPGMKLGLLGPNGSGKTTLIRLLSGEASPDRGEIVRAEGLRTVVFDQSREQLDKRQTLRKALSPQGENVAYRGSSLHVSAWARQFLFRTEQLDMPVGDLSGGEQARVLIARLMLQPADLLILDEPTNDLDIPSLEVMEESLADFPGALVLVTHDRYLLDNLSSELLALDGRGGATLYADLYQWERARDEAAAREAAAAKEAARAASRKDDKKAAGVKKLSYMELREFEGMEEQIMAAEQTLAECQRAMDDPATLADHRRLNEVCARAQAAQERVTGLYARWEALAARQA